MGLLDILNSIQDSSADPRARSGPASQGTDQGMSPIAKALLGLLAAYAAKSVTGSPPTQPGQPAGTPGGGLGDILGGVLGSSGRGGPGGAGAGAGAGGLGDILGGLLGGGGAGGGSVLNGEGTPADLPNALIWLKKAAVANMSHAQFVYGRLYDDGQVLKADPALGRKRWLQQILDRLKDNLNFFIVVGVLAFQSLNLVSEILVCCHDFTDLDESSHNCDVHQHGAITVED